MKALGNRLFTATHWWNVQFRNTCSNQSNPEDLKYPADFSYRFQLFYPKLLYNTILTVSWQGLESVSSVLFILHISEHFSWALESSCPGPSCNFACMSAMPAGRKPSVKTKTNEIFGDRRLFFLLTTRSPQSFKEKDKVHQSASPKLLLYT